MSDQPEIHQMELHDVIVIPEPHRCEIMRVPGGWIYTMIDLNGKKSSAFVPNSNEFSVVEPIPAEPDVPTPVGALPTYGSDRPSSELRLVDDDILEKGELDTLGLIVGFFALPLSIRRRTMEKFSLWDVKDRLMSDLERMKKGFKIAKEKGVLPQLIDEMRVCIRKHQH